MLDDHIIYTKLNTQTSKVCLLVTGSYEFSLATIMYHAIEKKRKQENVAKYCNTLHYHL